MPQHRPRGSHREEAGVTVDGVTLCLSTGRGGRIPGARPSSPTTSHFASAQAAGVASRDPVESLQKENLCLSTGRRGRIRTAGVTCAGRSALPQHRPQGSHLGGLPMAGHGRALPQHRPQGSHPALFRLPPAQAAPLPQHRPQGSHHVMRR